MSDFNDLAEVLRFAFPEDWSLPEYYWIERARPLCLDDLARIERRVIEMGYGYQYGCLLMEAAEMDKDSLVACLPAAARLRALVAVARGCKEAT